MEYSPIMASPTELREHLVVIGNGMAGCRAVEEVLARDPNRYRVTIFGAEPLVNYNRIMLSPVLPSRLPVGSSASSRGGPAIRARASATRCCSPPDICAG